MLILKPTPIEFAAIERLSRSSDWGILVGMLERAALETLERSCNVVDITCRQQQGAYMAVKTLVKLFQDGPDTLKQMEKL